MSLSFVTNWRHKHIVLFDRITRFPGFDKNIKGGTQVFWRRVGFSTGIVQLKHVEENELCVYVFDW
jgi:hypothetical protein